MIDPETINSLLKHVDLFNRFLAHIDNHKKVRSGLMKSWYDSCYWIRKYSNKLGINYFDYIK